MSIFNFEKLNALSWCFKGYRTGNFMGNKPSMENQSLIWDIVPDFRSGYCYLKRIMLTHSRHRYSIMISCNLQRKKMCALHKGNQEYEFSVYTWISLYNLDHIKSNIKGIEEGNYRRNKSLTYFPCWQLLKTKTNLKVWPLLW